MHRFPTGPLNPSLVLVSSKDVRTADQVGWRQGLQRTYLDLNLWPVFAYLGHSQPGLHTYCVLSPIG